MSSNTNQTNNIENNEIKNGALINEAFQKEIIEQAEANGLSLEEYIEHIKSNVNSNNNTLKNKSRNAISKIIENITFMSLKQVIHTDFKGSYMREFNGKFMGEQLDQGNSITHVLDLTTGVDSFVGSEFVPTALTNPQVESLTFALYNADGTLTTDAFQLKKSFSVQAKEWIPYFTQGNLAQFISNNIEKMRKSFDIYLYHKNMSALTNEANYSKKIDGAATDLFLAFVNEINPELIKFKFASSQYNLNDASKGINETTKEEIIVLANSKTFSQLSAGVLSQLPSTQFFNLEIDNSNIHIGGFKFTIGTGNTLITVLETEYVAVDKLFIFDAKSLKNHFQVSETGSQYYSNNLVEQITLHLWGLIGLIKWGKGFVYTNTNLTKLPSGA